MLEHRPLPRREAHQSIARRGLTETEAGLSSALSLHLIFATSATGRRARGYPLKCKHFAEPAGPWRLPCSTEAVTAWT